MGFANEPKVDPLPPGTIVDGRYRVVRFIDEGGAGRVHEVEHVLTGRRLALKTLLEGTGEGRLEQEARAASIMKNPHAVKITDMGKNPTFGAYVVMELLEGESLRGLLDASGQLPLDLTCDIAIQVCECLAEAHSHGIVHRDLKPENVHLCPTSGAGSYDVKVLDFGVVKISGEGPIPTSSLTRTGSTVGTPFYMSLEQLRSSSNVDARADIYSLSVVLYECLAGTKPFQAETLGDLVYLLCAGPPTPLRRVRPDLPADICDLVMRGLSTNRDERPQSMLDLASALAPYGDPALATWLRPEKRAELTSSSVSRSGALKNALRAPVTPASPPAITPASPPAITPPSPPPSTPASPPPSTPASPPPSTPPCTPAAALAMSPAAAPVSSPALPEVDTFGRAATVPAESLLELRAEPSTHLALPDLDLPIAPRSSTPLDTEDDGEELAIDHGLGPRGRDTPTEIYPKALEPVGQIDLDAGGPGGAMPLMGPAAGRSATPYSESYPGLVGHSESAPLVAPPSYDAGPYPPTPPPTSMVAPQTIAKPAAPRPAWQNDVDRVLSNVGHKGDRVGRALFDAFHAAPRQQQVALVAVSAAVFAVFLILMFVLTFGR